MANFSGYATASVTTNPFNYSGYVFASVTTPSATQEFSNYVGTRVKTLKNNTWAKGNHPEHEDKCYLKIGDDCNVLINTAGCRILISKKPKTWKQGNTVDKYSIC